VIRDDRELRARLTTAMVPLAMRIRDGTASAAEQQTCAHRLMVAGERVRRPATGVRGAVIEGKVLLGGALTFPTHTVEP
jgi:hypothetical protein